MQRQSEPIPRAVYLNRIATRYRDAKRPGPYICPHCRMAGVITPLKSRDDLLRHITQRHPR